MLSICRRPPFLAVQREGTELKQFEIHMFGLGLPDTVPPAAQCAKTGSSPPMGGVPGIVMTQLALLSGPVSPFEPAGVEQPTSACCS